MRNTKILIELLLSAFLILATAIPAHASVARAETVMPKLLYVPPSQNGFQELFVEEMLPSDCYRPAREEIRIDFLSKKVYVADKARRQHRGGCLTGFMSYMKKIALGRLPVGAYDLFFELPSGGLQKASTFTVQPP